MHTLRGYPIQALSTLCCLICKVFSDHACAFLEIASKIPKESYQQEKTWEVRNETGVKTAGAVTVADPCDLEYIYIYMSNLPVCRRAAHVHQLISHLPILHGFRF